MFRVVRFFSIARRVWKSDLVIASCVLGFRVLTWVGLQSASCSTKIKRNFRSVSHMGMCRHPFFPLASQRHMGVSQN